MIYVLGPNLIPKESIFQLYHNSKRLEIEKEFKKGLDRVMQTGTPESICRTWVHPITGESFDLSDSSCSLEKVVCITPTELKKEPKMKKRRIELVPEQKIDSFGIRSKEKGTCEICDKSTNKAYPRGKVYDL